MMQGELDRTKFELHALPIQAIGRTVLLSGAFSLLPVFAALVWLTIDSDAWPVTVCAEVVIAAVFVSLYLRFRLVYAGVTETRFVKRRLFLRFVAVDRDDIDRIVISRVYRHNSTESLTQLLALDAEGRRLFGLSGTFWADADIRATADALGVQTIVESVPALRSDYYARFPMARGWYETRLIKIGSIVVAAALVAVIVFGIQALVAMP